MPERISKAVIGLRKRHALGRPKKTPIAGQTTGQNDQNRRGRGLRLAEGQAGYFATMKSPLLRRGPRLFRMEAKPIALAVSVNRFRADCVAGVEDIHGCDHQNPHGHQGFAMWLHGRVFSNHPAVRCVRCYRAEGFLISY